MDVQSQLPEEWQGQADVVVVGYGCAGASAPITAHDLGADVLLLEKVPRGQEGGNTQGGPRRNTKSQIVRPDGRPIPRLYSAGELGSLYSFLYQGTGNIGECMALGRIAGRNAAADPSWT